MYLPESVERAFPEARQFIHGLSGGGGEIEPPYPRLFISVFDRWLGRKHIDLLTCQTAAERESRNVRLLNHWSLVADQCSLYELRFGRLIFVESRTAFLARCAYDPKKPARRFVKVFIPEFRAIYSEDWDDTNVVWYQDRDRVKPLLEWAEECGLHVLEDWRRG